jgi:hypothetical protein
MLNAVGKVIEYAVVLFTVVLLTLVNPVGLLLDPVDPLVGCVAKSK